MSELVIKCCQHQNISVKAQMLVQHNSKKHNLFTERDDLYVKQKETDVTRYGGC